MTHKVAMRRRLAEGGVPQPQFAAIRAWREAAAAADTVGFPAVLKPADSGGQRGLFLLRSFADLERHFHAALAESPSGETILEEFTDGLELNGLVVARGGEPYPLLLSDRLRPDGVGFGVGWIHSYPSRLFGDALEEAERVALRAVRTLGLRDGIAFPQLIVTDDGRALVVEVAARIPGGQMADLAFHALGVDLVQIALRQALGEGTPDDLVVPRISRPTAIRFLTAHPGPLPLGTVRRIGSLDRVLAAPGVVQADVFLQVGEEIRPVRLDGDRRGYVIATGDTNVQALELAEDAALKLYVETE
jgi:biotin carboxylase